MEDLPFPIPVGTASKAILICMEPIEIKSVYHPLFLKQFDAVLTWRKDIQHSCNLYRWVPYPWFYGVHFDQAKRIPKQWSNFTEIENQEGIFSAPRPVSCSFIISPKKLCQSHRLRIRLMKYLQEQMPELSVHGFSEPFGDKREILTKSQTSIIIENNNEKHGFTEKIQDCFLGGSHPFYWGCENLEQYFPTQSFTRIPLHDPERCLSIIQEKIRQEIWVESLSARQYARQLVLRKYNIFLALGEISRELPFPENRIQERVSRWLWPESFFPRWNWLNLSKGIKAFLWSRLINQRQERATTLLVP
jgi:hypothetical protein